MNEETRLNEPADLAPVESSQEAAVPAASAGAQLKALREARGWSVGQVANQLNLAARQIDALEQDNYAALPGMVIVRGFIRTYAKLLHADAAPMLAALKDEGGAAAELPSSPRSVSSASFSETRLKTDEARGFPLKWVIAAFIVLLVVALIVFQGQRMGWKMERRAPEAGIGAAAPVAGQQTPAPAAQTAPAAAASSASSAQAEAVAAPASQPAAETKPAEESAPAAAGKNVLAIRVREDSWIEIRRADNDKVVFSDLLKAGASETIDLPGPATMVVGNAAGVDVTLRGVPVDLKGNASNVAHINLK